MMSAAQRIASALVRVPGVLRVPERCFFSLVVWLCSNGRASCGERKWGLINAKSMCDGCLTRMQSRFSRFMSTRHTHTRAPCRNRQMKSFPASSACSLSSRFLSRFLHRTGRSIRLERARFCVQLVVHKIWNSIHDWKPRERQPKATGGAKTK